MNEKEIIDRCPCLFEGLPGSRIRLAKELRKLRANRNQNDSLRLRGEFNFYRRYHIGVNFHKFKKRVSKRGYPSYFDV